MSGVKVHTDVDPGSEGKTEKDASSISTTSVRTADKAVVIRDFDEVFDYIGQAGLFQIVLYLLLGLPSYYSGYQNIAMTFLAPDQHHWCAVPELLWYPHEVQQCVAIPYEDGSYAECDQYAMDYSALSPNEILSCPSGGFVRPTNATTSCDSWMYDQSEFTRTAVSEYDLVCDRTFLVSLSSSIYLLGILVGAPLSGIISDKYGRKVVLLGGCACELLFALIAAFMPTFASFSVMRFLTSMSVTHAYLTAFVIIMEVIGPQYRTLAGVFYQIWFSIGFMLLPAYSYFVRDFRYLQVVMALPVVVTVLYVMLVPESPRWLLIQGREEEAEQICRDIAEINQLPMPDELHFKLKEEDGEKGSFLDLFRYPVLRREILIIYLGWFTNSLVYYGLSLNTGDLVGSVFLNTFISGSVEIPANIICILTMAYIGRRPTLAWSYIAAGVSAFLCIPFLDNPDLAWLVTTFTMLGKAAITISFSTIYVYTAELFPTPVRHLAVGSASMMSRISGLVAPFMGEPLMQVWLPLPSVIFGVTGLLSGILTFLLPETLNRTLPDTIAEAEEIGRLGNKRKNVVTVDIDAPQEQTGYGSMELSRSQSRTSTNHSATDTARDQSTRDHPAAGGASRASLHSSQENAAFEHEV